VSGGVRELIKTIIGGGCPLVGLFWIWSKQGCWPFNLVLQSNSSGPDAIMIEGGPSEVRENIKDTLETKVQINKRLGELSWKLDERKRAAPMAQRSWAVEDEYEYPATEFPRKREISQVRLGNDLRIPASLSRGKG